MVERGAVLLVLLASCSDDIIASTEPDPPPRASFEPICGTEGPHLLLPLSLGEHAYGVVRGADDERVLVSTFFVDPAQPLASLPPTLDLAIYAAGPCGEAPVELARGLVLTSWDGDLVLACNDGGHGALVLDLQGMTPPRPILDAWCPLRSTDAGLLAVEADPDARFGTLVLLRNPTDPNTTPEVLATSIRTSHNTFFGPGSGSSTSLWTRGAEAVALAEDGVVWRFDLVTGHGTPELDGVRELRVSGDGRFMIWQAQGPAEGDPETPTGPVFLRDRSQQTDAHLLDTHLEWTGNPYAGDYVVLRDDVVGQRVFRAGDEAPSQPITLPDGTDYRGVLPDGALWVARKVDGETEELRWVPGDAAPTLIVRHGGSVSRRSDGLEIFDDDDVPAPSEGSLSFAPFDGSAGARLADHVHASRGRLADGRILTIVHEDETGHGPLRLLSLDEGSGEGTWVQLHPRGFVQSPRLSHGNPLDGDVVFATDEGAEGVRGVYRARVAG